jgi:hypothetical protein
MSDPARRVFLSYRRASWPLAALVLRDLTRHGFDVFLDTHSLGGGEFEQRILTEIAMRRHFLLLLEPRSLDRLADDGDWLRREIAHALAHRRNVVPLLANGVQVPAAADLPADIAQLPAFNAVAMPREYVAAALQRVRERFLRDPPPPGAPSGAASPTLHDPDGPEAGGVVEGGLDPLRPTPRWKGATNVDQGVRLEWRAVPDAVGYTVEVERQEGDDLWPARFLDGSLPPAAVEVFVVRPSYVHEREHTWSEPVSWSYRVRAEFDDGDHGPWSTEYVVPM